VGNEENSETVRQVIEEQTNRNSSIYNSICPMGYTTCQRILKQDQDHLHPYHPQLVHEVLPNDRL
jgi:hypothetical protein